MPVNDFEKQVQQSMEELQLRPSGAVWEEVEKRIRKDKKRRLLFIWIPLLAILLGGGTVFVITQNKKPGNTTVNEKNIANNSNKEEIEQSTTTSPNQATTNNNNTPDNGIDNNPAVQDASRTKASPVIDPVQSSPSRNDKVKINPAVTIDPDKKAATIKTTKASTQKTKKAVSTKPSVAVSDKEITNEPAETIVSKSVQQLPVNNTLDPLHIKNTPAENRNDSTASQPPIDTVIPQALKTVEKAEPLKPVETTTATKKKPGKSKWEFGITAIGGSSGKTGPLRFGPAKMELQRYSPGISNGLGPVMAPSPAGPSIPERGFSGGIGAYAKRKFTERTGLSVGLNFSVLSTMQLTGRYIDTGRVILNDNFSSSVQDFFQNGDINKRPNNYFIIGVPVSFDWQVNRSKKLPLTWENGLTAGWIAGSDALLYSPVQNVFYRDNSLLNRFQLSYQTGLSVRLFNKARHPLSAGVQFNYHFSKLQKVNTDWNNHLTSFGLKLGWVLK